MRRTLQPDSRQWEIVVLVARQSPVTLAEMAEKVGLARTSMRQQVDRLVSEGWLDRARRRGRRGRPVDVFSLSEQGRRLFANRTDEFVRSLLQEIAEKQGRSKLRASIKGVGRRLAHQLRPAVGEGTPQERMHRLAGLFSERGALNDVTCSEGNLKLALHTCPYHGMSDGLAEFCKMERDMINSLVGEKTRLTRSMPQGNARCEFEVDVGPARP
ncbi:MAG: MarR family transcriptional regulator [Planctomycetota bacterium]